MRLPLILVFFSLSTLLLGQRSDKFLDITFTPTSLGVKTTGSLSGLGFMTSGSLELGLHFTVSDRFAFAVSNSFNLHASWLDEYDSNNKIRFKSLYKFFDRRDRLCLNAGLEYAYSKGYLTMYDDDYRFEGDKYAYTEAEIHHNIQTFSGIFNMEYHFDERWAFDLTAGMGIRFVKLEAKNTVGLRLIDVNNTDGLFDYNSRRMGTHARFHVPFQLTLRYSIIKT